MAADYCLTIQQGRTFRRVLRWEVPPIVYKAITAITKAAPARITAPAHGLVAGWRAAVVSVLGMTQINASNPPKNADYHKVTVIDADTVELNGVNAAGFSAYKSGGYLQYNTPVDLTGYTARMDIKDRIGGTVLHSLTTENGGITLDAALRTIALHISATDTAAFNWATGVYDLEMIASDDTVTPLIGGTVAVTKEVTT